MKFQKRALSSLALAMLASSAAAQNASTNVRVYGLVDAGVQYLTNADASGRSKVSLDSGQWTASRLGFSIKEDLGGGSYIDALLENRFSTDTGAFASPTLFSGFCQLSYGGNFGKLTIGRQTSISVDKIAYYDPAGAFTYGIYNVHAIPFQNLRINNSLKYESPAVSNINFSVQYGFGQELAGHSSAGAYMGAAVEHKASNWTTRAYYEQTHGTVAGLIDNSAQTDRRFSLATRYKDDKFDVFVGATDIRGDLKLTPLGAVYWLSAGYTFTPAVKAYLLASQYRMSGNGGNTTILSASAQYFLSKRSSLYAAVGQINNANNTAFGIQLPFDAGAAGVKQVGVTTGIMHVF